MKMGKLIMFYLILAAMVAGCGPGIINTKNTKPVPRFAVGQYVYAYGTYKAKVVKINSTFNKTQYIYCIVFPWMNGYNLSAADIADSDLSPTPDATIGIPVNIVQPATTPKLMDRNNMLTNNEQWANAEFYNTEVLIDAAMTEFKNMSPNIVYSPGELYIKMKVIDSTFRIERKCLSNDVIDTNEDE